MGVIRRNSDEIIRERDDLFGEGRRRSWRRKKKAPAKKRGKGRSRGQSRLLPLMAWGGILAACLPLAAGSFAVGGLAAWVRDAPPIMEFEAYDPPETTTILDRDGQTVAALFEQRRQVVALDSLPNYLPQAFIAIEDERFHRHFGVDPPGIARAALINLKRGRLSQGASTITQQTVRNVLPRVGAERTLRRKVQELLIALQVERRYTKEQILEVYLNQIYLGSGTWGVEAAARAYFGKGAADVTIPEAALLAGLPQLPERYSPLNDPEAALRRREQVLWKLLETESITPAQYGHAQNAALELSPEPIPTGRAPYFVDAVRREASRIDGLQGDRLTAAGWTIETTIRPVYQDIARDVLRQGLDAAEEKWLEGRQERYRRALEDADHDIRPRAGQQRMARVVAFYEKSIVLELPGGWRGDLAIPEATRSYFTRGPHLQPGQGVDVRVTDFEPARGLFRGELLPSRRMQGALVALDRRNGDVLALVGGREFNDPLNHGFYNRAIQAKRQVGSTFKPFFFAAALERGNHTPWTVLRDSPLEFRDGYRPRNYDNTFQGTVTMQRALERSRNIPTINLVQSLGLRDTLRYVRSFQRTGQAPWDLPLEWPVVLGTTSLSPLELASAWQPLANQGLARGPRIIRSVASNQARESLDVPVRAEEVLLGARSSAWLTQMLVGVMTHGTGQPLRQRLPENLREKVAGKSGTTNDLRDAWFAGFSPHDVVVVWVGFDHPLPLAPGQTGSHAAGPIWANFMARAWESKSPAEQAAPLALPAGYQFVAIDPRNGQVLDPGDPAWVDPPTLRVHRDLPGGDGPFRPEPGVALLQPRQ